MARAIVLFLLVVAIAYSAAFPQEPELSKECGPNEVFNACGSPCQKKCGEDLPPVCTMMCAIGCQCKDGYVRNSHNQCVLTRDC